MNDWHKYIDFHFALALVAILGTAASLSLQFNQANSEFEILAASAFTLVHSQENSGIKENVSLNQTLDQLEKEFSQL